MHKLILHRWSVLQDKWVSLLGSDAFQETDIRFQPVTKWNYQITEASIPEIMAKAFTLHDQDVQGPF
jgi:thiamine pyrophosphate-dependent acetolactate synthase large subunit-like protein